jgi:hypothetical protein
MMNSGTNQVVTTDTGMPYLSMALFMVKAAIAAIPAIIMHGILWTLVAAIFGRGRVPSGRFSIA